MNRDNDFDGQLTAWLRREAPPQAPDRVLAWALQRVATEPQRVGWLASVTGRTRIGLVLRGAAVAAVLAGAAVVGLQLGNRAPSVGGPTPSAMASASPSGSASGSPAASPTVTPDIVLPPNSLALVVEELEMREAPGTSGPLLTTIGCKFSVMV